MLDSWLVQYLCLAFWAWDLSPDSASSSPARSAALTIAPLGAATQIHRRANSSLWVHLPEHWSIAEEPQGANTFSWWYFHHISKVQRHKEENKDNKAAFPYQWANYLWMPPATSLMLTLLLEGGSQAALP